MKDAPGRPQGSRAANGPEKWKRRNVTAGGRYWVVAEEGEPQYPTNHQTEPNQPWILCTTSTLTELDGTSHIYRLLPSNTGLAVTSEPAAILGIL